MATYKLDSMGAAIVATDDGREVRTAMAPEALESQGIIRRDDSFLQSREPSPLAPEPADFNAQRIPEPKMPDPLEALIKRLDDTRAKEDPTYAATRERRKMEEADKKKNAEMDRAVEEARQNAERAKAMGPQPTSQLTMAELNSTMTDAPDMRAAIGMTEEPPTSLAPPVTLNPVRPPSEQGSSESSAPPENTAARRIYDMAMQGAVRRSGATPGGMRPASKTVARGEVIAPEDLQAIDEAELQAESQRMQGVTDMSASLEANIIAPQAEALRRQMDNLDAQKERRKKYDAKLLELEKFAEKQEAKAVDFKPQEQFRGAPGIFAQMLSAVGVALGAAAATQSGQPNYALQIAQDAAKQHAERQRRAYERLEAEGKTASNAYSEALKVYGDPNAAQQALEDEGEAVYRRLLELNAMKHSTPEMVAKVQQENADAAVQRKIRWAERNGKAAGQTSESFQYQAPSGGGVSVDAKMLGIGLDAAKLLAADTGKEAEVMKLSVRMPDGSFNFATDEATKKVAQQQIKVDNRIWETVQRIKQLRKELGNRADPEKRAAIKGAAADLFLSLKAGANLGTLDKGSLDFRDEWIGKPTDLIDFGGADALLDEVGGAAMARIEDTARFDLHKRPASLTPIRGAAPKGVQSDE